MEDASEACRCHSSYVARTVFFQEPPTQRGLSGTLLAKIEDKRLQRKIPHLLVRVFHQSPEQSSSLMSSMFSDERGSVNLLLIRGAPGVDSRDEVT